MRYTDDVEAVERESAAFAAALAGADADQPVPSCPGWTLRDLAAHVGSFMAFWSAALHAADPSSRPDLAATGDAERVPDDPDTDDPDTDDPDTDDLGEWFARRRAGLLDALRATGPTTPVWSWADDRTAAFAARRAANELAVHRVDAELARGAPRPVDAARAVDAIDEIDVIMRVRATAAGTGETIHAHATDIDGGEWFVVLGADGFEMRHEHAKGDLALRGAVSDLLLVLYGRPPIGEVDRLGDEAVLEVWRRLWAF